MSSSINSQRSVKFGQRIEQPSLQLKKSSLAKHSTSNDVFKKEMDLFLSSLLKSPKADNPQANNPKSKKLYPSIFKNDININKIANSNKILPSTELPTRGLKNILPLNHKTTDFISPQKQLLPIDAQKLSLPGKQEQNLKQPDHFKPGVDVKKVLENIKEEERKQSSIFRPISNFVHGVSCLIPPRVTVVSDLRNASEEAKISYDPISVDELFPDGHNTFRQRDVGNCYALAAFDGIFQHPELLRAIRFEANRDPNTQEARTYRVSFPSGRCAEFDADDLGQLEDGMRPVNGPLGVQLLERAHAIVTREDRNARRPAPYPNGGKGHTLSVVQAGDCIDVLRDLFGKMLHPQQNTVVGSTVTNPLSETADKQQQLLEQLAKIAEDSEHTYIMAADTPVRLADSEPDYRFITIRRDDGGTMSFHREHAYAIRSFDLATKTISLVNPHNTEEVIPVSVNEFCQAFWRFAAQKFEKTKPEKKESIAA